MTHSPKFNRLMKTVVQNAPKYKTKTVCCAMMTRVRHAWERAGAYGCNKHLWQEAYFACFFRLQELRGIEWDAKFDLPAT